MKNALSLLLASLLVSLLATTANAQQGSRELGSSYLLKKIDGTPIVPGVVHEVVVVPIFGIPGAYAFFVLQDGQAIEGEEGMIWETGVGTWGWQNARGTTGTLKLKADGSGDIESEVGSGPNKGTQRLWDAR